ncbi:hypothetical protein MUB15_23820 [Priestia sp. OVS21]|nr:hypothetical protein [Priestia sp. OVS21]
MNKSALYVKNILLYAGAFFLLVEWLLPLNEVTDTNQIQYFILFVAYCFLCLTFRLPFIVMTLGSILFILFSLHNLYFQGAFFLQTGFRDFWRFFSQMHKVSWSGI